MTTSSANQPYAALLHRHASMHRATPAASSVGAVANRHGADELCAL